MRGVRARSSLSTSSGPRIGLRFVRRRRDFLIFFKRVRIHVDGFFLCFRAGVNNANQILREPLALR